MDLNWVNFENPVALWWIFLTAASLVNLAIWTWTYFYLKEKNRKPIFSHFLFNPNNLIYLSFLYTSVCAYRSIFPKADVQRIALFDNYLSSVFLGRTLATIAELAFILQWSTLIYFFGSLLNSKLLKAIAASVLGLILLAEHFSWYAVITTNYIGNTIEESLWATSYTLIFVSLFKMFKHVKGYLKGAIFSAITGSVLYVLFMVTVDVPMYFNRWIQDSNSGKVYFGLWQGLVDLNTRWVITYDIADWKTEIPWMTLYFTFAVLVSIAMCFVPTDKRILNHIKT